MPTWKCIFDATTLIGTGCNREPVSGEIARNIDVTLCGFFNTTPDRYKLENGVLTERPEWPGEEAARQAQMASDLAALQTRLAGIEAAQQAEGLKSYTIEQARTWITNKIDGATTVAGVKQEVKEILLKMVPYLLT
jgi:hypothetical protein